MRAQNVDAKVDLRLFYAGISSAVIGIPTSMTRRIEAGAKSVPLFRSEKSFFTPIIYFSFVYGRFCFS